MKRNIILGALMLVSSILFAQQPVITFTTTEHDFGKIMEADGRVTTIFEFQNEGMEPLVLTNVRASCGCTTPTWTKTPIEPGQKGQITVTYNPNGRPGKFTKTITVTSNATESTKKLYIRGEVIPKQQTSTNHHPIKMGNANVSKKVVNFGTILNTGNKTQIVEYTNNTDQPIEIDVLVTDAEPWVLADASLKVVQPKQVGTLKINYDAAKSKKFGTQTSYIFLMVDGKKVLTDEFKITLNVNIEEDFSPLTAQDRLQAPIIEMAEEFNLGVIKAGAIVKKSLSIKNVGINPLLVRAINNSDKGVKVLSKPNSVKSGKKSEIKIEVKADAKPGVYRRQIEVITNDYKNAKKKVTIVWTVE